MHEFPPPRRRWASRSPSPGVITMAAAAQKGAAAGAASARSSSPRGTLAFASAPWRQTSRPSRPPLGECAGATTEGVEMQPGEWEHVKKALYAYRTHRLKYTSSAAYREYCAVRGWTLNCKEGVVSPYKVAEVPPYTVPKKWLVMQEMMEAWTESRCAPDDVRARVRQQIVVKWRSTPELARSPAS